MTHLSFDKVLKQNEIEDLSNEEYQLDLDLKQTASMPIAEIENASNKDEFLDVQSKYHIEKI